MAMTLMEFTQSVNPRTLPRILQIQSGIYLQGGVYELFGRECCLVTGDLMKIIDIGITRFIAQSSNKVDFHLPLEYPGLFRMVADPQAYLSISEIVQLLKISSHRLGQPSFSSSVSIALAHGSLKANEMFRITSVSTDQDGQGRHVECEVLHREPKFCFTLDLSQQGHFTECEDDQFYTLKELADWKIPKGRRRMVMVVKELPVTDLLFSDVLGNVSGELTLTPVYELQAVMTLRKNVVVIPSNLDVEVMDVTDKFDTNLFIQPLSLHDVFHKPPEVFPFIAEVIERPVMERTVPEDLDSLFVSSHIIVHQAYEAKRILASEIRQESPRHFLIPDSYNGRLKRRPREFPTAYDLKRAQSNTEKLHVVATRAFGSDYEGLASVLVGDEFILRKDKSSEVEIAENMDSLMCLKIKGKSHETVHLPMSLDGGFMEVIHDKRQYSIAEICRWFPLPFNVKVSVRDLSLKEDILAGVLGLHIEEEIADHYLLVSNLDLSSWWEIPVNRINMTVHLEKQWNGRKPTRNVNLYVEDISEQCYYTMRRYAVSTVMPPPRPPKAPKQPLERSTKMLHVKPEKVLGCSPKTPRSPTVIREDSTDCTTSDTGSKCASIIPGTTPRPAAPIHKALAISRGWSLEEVCGKDLSEDDTHDYESIDEDELENIRKQFQQQSISIVNKTKPSNTI